MNLRHFSKTNSRVSLLVSLCAALLFSIPAPLQSAEKEKSPQPPAKPVTKSSEPSSAKNPTVASSATTPAVESVEQLVERVGKSTVVVSFEGRDGKEQGLGTGFVVDANGLIATNMHVIGEARPITVKFSNGNEFPVTEIYATERSMDLAIIRIDARNLPALELGDSAALAKGAEVLALGNPLGLKHSVVRGVLSGRREIDGKPMLQLAIPIERGNSGGPVIDMNGQVHGIVTMKSLVTENLGFAVEVNALKPLLEKPNPLPISRWLTIGALDTRDWTILHGSRWRQRAGQIQVSGRGQGFGGRSLCLSNLEMPELPFEVGVAVKLEDEAGAAGLVFHADGEDKHFGFYPSNGQLRLSRFDGADVFNWQVLEQIRSPHYRSGEWNWLKVRVSEDSFQCFVNDELVVETTDRHYVKGQLGIAKFRDTVAQFKHFQVAKSIASRKPSEDDIERISAKVAAIPADRPPNDDLVEQLLPFHKATSQVLAARAKVLEQQAERLRQLAAAIHEEQVQAELVETLEKPEAEIDLLQAALLLAKLDNEEVDVESYRNQVDRMLAEVNEDLPKDANDIARIEALDRYFFKQLGFHGSRTNYYSRANSYLNEVIDDREGLPITLSVLYMEMSRRLGANVVGVGMPGHFVVRFQPEKGKSELIDVFEEGRRLTRADAAKRVQEMTDRKLDEEDLRESTKQEIVVRMLRNLMGNARSSSNIEAMLRYVDTIVTIDSQAHQERWFRAVLRFQTDRLQEAKDDVSWLLERRPAGVDLERVEELRQFLDRVSSQRQQ